MTDGTSLHSRQGCHQLPIAEQASGLLSQPVQRKLNYQGCIDDEHVFSASRVSDGQRLLRRASAPPSTSYPILRQRCERTFLIGLT